MADQTVSQSSLSSGQESKIVKA